MGFLERRSRGFTVELVFETPEVPFSGMGFWKSSFQDGYLELEVDPLRSNRLRL
jgi:hypothetical protein